MRIGPHRAAGLLLVLLVAASGAEPLVIAHEDVPVLPWIGDPGRGLDCDLVRQAAAQVHEEVRFEVMPWKRCLVMLEAGQVDGLLAASYQPDRAVFARYPMTAEGEPDPGRRLHMDSYGLYRLKGSEVGFDGERLVGVDGRIAAQSGFSVIAQLRDLGAEVDEDSKEMEPILRRLTAGRVVAAALLTASADRYISTRPEFAQRIERAPTPLVSKPYYLIVSDDCYRRSPERIEALWSAIGEARVSDAHRDRMRAISDWER